MISIYIGQKSLQVYRSKRPEHNLVYEAKKVTPATYRRISAWVNNHPGVKVEVDFWSTMFVLAEWSADRDPRT